MKLAKMSMVAALLLGVNAYAIDNVKVNGDARLYYSTTDSDAAGAPDMFDSGASAGDAAIHLGLTADLTEGVSAGVSMTAVSTLGLENNLVNNTWSAAHTGEANPSAGATAIGAVQVNDEMWVDEAWLAGTAGNTTLKAGRQALDTPLAFTETWGIDTNTFEAAVLINQDLPDTTLIGAYVGKSNGSGTALDAQAGHGIAGYVNNGSQFDSFYNGAYVAGLVNNSFKPLTFQGWYYDLQTTATAYWLQADIECSLVEGLLIGAQYTEIDADQANNDEAYAVMLGYAIKDVATIKAAYSSVDDQGTTLGGVANVATGVANAGQSKLYTEMWWNYGNVSATGADSYAITAEGTAGGVDLFAGYYFADIDVAGNANDQEVTEITVTAGKDFGPLNVTGAVILDEYDVAVGTDVEQTTLQVYLTYNF